MSGAVSGRGESNDCCLVAAVMAFAAKKWRIRIHHHGTTCETHWYL